MLTLIFRMTSAEWHKFDKDPYYQTYNSQVLHYSRRDPVTGRISHDINWFRTYCTQSRTFLNDRRIDGSHRSLESFEDSYRLGKDLPPLVDQ